MNKALVLGVALTALASAGLGVAAAQPEHHRTMMHHGAMGGDLDTNHDGWLSRAEASAAADRIFAELDTDHDGRLTREDHAHDETFNMHVAPGGEMSDENCETTVEPPQAQGSGHQERRVTVICRDEDAAAPHAEAGHRVERHVVIVRNDDEDAEAPEAPEPPEAPMPPHPPHPPMFMMLMANSEEADANGDGALSRDEFRAQHLRFFDASDANGDGKIRFSPPDWVNAPPIPPVPPVAPVPPTPPPRHH